MLLFNHSDVDFTVEAGDRVAQLILEKVEYSEVVEVEVRSLFPFSLLSGTEKRRSDLIADSGCFQTCRSWRRPFEGRAGSVRQEGSERPLPRSSSLSLPPSRELLRRSGRRSRPFRTK